MVLKAKFEHFLKSIADEDIKKLIQENTIITGGAITSLLLNDDPNDFDIYFTNSEVTEKVTQYFVDKFKETRAYQNEITVNRSDDRVTIKIQSAGIASSNEEQVYEYFEQYDGDDENTRVVEYISSVSVKRSEDKGKYEPICLTENAITLSDRIQIIIRFSGPPEIIHNNFDFVHCHCYWQSADGKLVLPPDSIESILTKELRYTGSLFPVATLFRIRKFIKRGWNINAGQIFKIAWQVSQLDMNDPKVLREQLTGCDVLFFHSLIAKLNEIENGESLTNDYLMNLVDQVFDGE